jgi:hypothetical protein
MFLSARRSLLTPRSAFSVFFWCTAWSGVHSGGVRNESGGLPSFIGARSVVEKIPLSAGASMFY